MSNPPPEAVPTRHNGGPTLRGQSPRGTARKNSQRSRWTCPSCGSEKVQIRLPVWFHEYRDGELVEVNIDEEADPDAYYCENCYACEKGTPALTEIRHQTRDFRGYFQFRAKAVGGPWRFYISGFSGPTHPNGTDSRCSVLRSDGSCEADVPIDEHGRITILGRKYGSRRWDQITIPRQSRGYSKCEPLKAAKRGR